MNEPDGDQFSLPAQPAEPKRIPLWKLEEMAGNPAPPEGWRGNAAHQAGDLNGLAILGQGACQPGT